MVWIRKNLVGPQRRPKERRKVSVIGEHGTFIDYHKLYGLSRIFVGLMICVVGLNSIWGCKFLKRIE